jgi:hypothetical protein
MLRLTAVSGSDVILGGAETQSSTYHLSQAEAEAIESANIIFDAVAPTGSAAPNVIVRDLLIGGSLTEGGGVASVALNTLGDVIIEGALRYANAAAGDRLSITAGESIQLITGGGSILMTDTAGKLAGTLALSADDIWIGSAELIGKLRADPNFAGRDAALAANSGTARPEGYAGAGAMSLSTGNSLFVQNSGTSTDFAGLSVGEGGLTIASTGTQPATVIAYGRQQRADGTIVGGNAFYGTVTFVPGPSGFGQGSSLNGCPVPAGCAPPPPPPPPPPPAEPPAPPGRRSARCRRRSERRTAAPRRCRAGSRRPRSPWRSFPPAACLTANWRRCRG